MKQLDGNSRTIPKIKSNEFSYSKDSDDIYLFAEEIEHNHGQKRPKNKLPEESANRAKQLFNHYSNREILRKLRSEGLPQLTQQQLANLKVKVIFKI